MQAPKPQLPRNVTVSLLWLYVVMGIASIAIGSSLGYTAYQMRGVGGARFVLLVAGVVIAFGIWRCALAFYHLRRINRARSKPR